MAAIQHSIPGLGGHWNAYGGDYVETATLQHSVPGIGGPTQAQGGDFLEQGINTAAQASSAPRRVAFEEAPQEEPLRPRLGTLIQTQVAAPLPFRPRQVIPDLEEEEPVWGFRSPLLVTHFVPPIGLANISSVAVEALEQNTPPIRTGGSTAEVLRDVADQPVRTGAVPAEVLRDAAQPPARTGGAAVEALHTGVPNVDLAGEVVEALHSGRVKVREGQVVVEVLRDFGQPLPGPPPPPPAGAAVAAQYFEFGSGIAVSVRQDLAPPQTPRWLGILQSIEITFDGESRPAFGTGIFPIDAPRGHTPVRGKAKFATQQASAINALLFGQAASPGQLKFALDEAAIVPGGAHHVTVANSGPPFTDEGVFYAPGAIPIAADGEFVGAPLIAVDGLPGTGEYVFDTTLGRYTFSDADLGAALLLNYLYTDPGGFNIAIGNPPMGQAPHFQLRVWQRYEGHEVLFVFNNCVVKRLSNPSKNDDYLLSDIEFSCALDGNGSLGVLSFEGQVGNVPGPPPPQFLPFGVNTAQLSAEVLRMAHAALRTDGVAAEVLLARAAAVNTAALTAEVLRDAATRPVRTAGLVVEVLRSVN